MNNFDLEFSDSPVIKVIGVGGGGSNAVIRMREHNVNGVEFIICNTDAQALRSATKVDLRIQIGKATTKGLGAGSDPNQGRLAAEESIDEIRAALAGSNLVFVTAGMGGGTGTGAAPVVAKVAKEFCDLTVAVVTRPFTFEGTERLNNALEGIENLREHVDALLVIPNDKLRYALDKNITVINAFYEADRVLRSAVQGISDLITFNGVINVDFADIKRVMSNCGTAVLGIGQASGDNKTIEAARKAMNSPLLENNLNGARRAIIGFSSGRNFQLQEVTAAVQEIRNQTNNQLDLIYGQIIQDDLEDEVYVTIIATGFPEKLSLSELQERESKKSFVLQSFGKDGEDRILPNWVKDLFDDR